MRKQPPHSCCRHVCSVCHVCLGQPLGEPPLAVEEHLTLVGEVPEVGALGHAGAGGMVGYAAVQLALRRGARVIATAGPTFASDLEGFGAIVTPYGEGMVERVRSLADRPIDHVLDVSRPNAGAIAALIEITGDPRRVVTISNHDEARSQGARVNIDELMAAGGFPNSDFLADYACAKKAVAELTRD